MLNENMEKALNDQIVAELYSAYLYLSMAAYFESINLRGASNWMRCQAQEETVHGMKFYDYIIERGGKVTLGAIDQPPSEWDSSLAVYEAALGHEREVTARINKLVDLSVKEGDHATNNILQWFVAEQVEEEASADEVVQQLRMVGTDGGGLFMVDRELAQRVFTPPADTAA